MTEMEEIHTEEQQEMGEESVNFINVEELQKHGINVADISKLRSAGISTVLGVLMATKKQMTAIKGISEAKMEKMKEAAAKMTDSTFMSAHEYFQQRQNIHYITTGCKEFDTLLGGKGIESMAITEIYGEFRTGKSQICHTLAVTAQLPESEGGASGRVAYIDTEGTFRPERLAAIAERFGVDPEAVMQNVMFARALNSEHQMELINQCAAKFAEDGSYRLLIIDSIMAMFRVDFSGRGELSERQQKLAQMMSKLTKLSLELDVAVVVTNQVTADPGATLSFVANMMKPIGGNIMAHMSTIRLALRKGRAETRLVKVADAPNLPEAEATFMISPGGITDASD